MASATQLSDYRLLNAVSNEMSPLLLLSLLAQAKPFPQQRAFYKMGIEGTQGQKVETSAWEVRDD